MRILRILFLEFVEFSGNKLRIWLRIFVTFYTTDPCCLLSLHFRCDILAPIPVLSCFRARNSECRPSTKTPNERHARWSIGRCLDATRLFVPRFCRLLVVYGGCTAGHPNLRRPIRKFNEFRFANFFSGVDIFAACS